MSQDQLIYEAMMREMGPDENAEWEEAYGPLERASIAQGIAGLSELGINTAKWGTEMASGIKPVGQFIKSTGADKAMKFVPGVGTTLGVAQGLAQRASGINPYGEGNPSNWQLFNDAVESSAGALGAWGMPVQLMLGGMGSDIANHINMTEERKRNKAMLESGNLKDLERQVLFSNPRDWDRNKVSQMITGRLNRGEQIRRSRFVDQYLDMPQEQKLAALTQELADREEWDATMADTDFLTKIFHSFKTLRKTPTEQAQASRDFVKGQREIRSMAERWRNDPFSAMIN